MGEIFKDNVEMMVFVTMADIDDRWTKEMTEDEKHKYYKAIIKRLSKRLPKEEGAEGK